MLFEYYLIVQKKKSRTGQIMVFKEEADGTQKFVPIFKGYQKGTLFQSFRSADEKRRKLNMVGIDKTKDLYVQLVPVNIDFELPNEQK